MGNPFLFNVSIMNVDIRIYLHKQLNAGVSEEHLSDYYSLLDTKEGTLIGLNEALCILQAAWLNYTEREL